MRNIAIPLLACAALTACQTVPPKGPFTAGQVTALQRNGFTPVGDGWQFGMADRLLFATDESTLIPQQKGAISRIAAALTAVAIHGARVEGHTDSIGTATYNKALSMKRAQAVADALQAGGMTRAALHAFAMGEGAPIDSNNSAQGRRENRRVVIIVSPTDAMTP
jgi:OOP family OmpA-OmpF porin